MTPDETLRALRTSPLEARLLHRLERAGLPAPERQVRLVEGRRWTWDMAWPMAQGGVCVEVQGGTWSQGAHSRGRGYRRDAEKRAAVQMRGWLALDVTADMIDDGSAVRLIAAALGEQARETA